jgi:hypothetical protein
MHIIVTARALELKKGALVGISEKQAARRMPFLKPVPKRSGWYELTGTVQFKRGETLQVEGDVPKALADTVEAPKRAGKAAGGEKPPAGTGKAAGGDGDDTAAGGGDTQAGGAS